MSVEKIHLSLTHQQSDSDEWVERVEEDISYTEACTMLEAFPWDEETQRFIKTQQAGAFSVMRGDFKKRYALMTFYPEDEKRVRFAIAIRHKMPLVLGLGQKKLSKDMGKLPREVIPNKLRELFNNDIASLYQRYQK